MDVKQLIAQIAQLGVGNETPTSSDEAAYLGFLNLAYLELYSDTVTVNPFIKFNREELDCENGLSGDTELCPLYIKTVYEVSRNVKLEPADIDSDILNNDPGIKSSGFPEFWYYFNNNLYVYPKYTGKIGILYSPVIDGLGIEYEEKDIPIPSIFHSVLVHGACYYLYQDEGGFRDSVKFKESSEKWEEGKKKIVSFLKTISGNKRFSTFSKV